MPISNSISVITLWLAMLSPEPAESARSAGRSATKGKSGGVQIIYVLITKEAQIVLLDIYAKSNKDNLTQAERNRLKKITTAYKRSERSKR